MISRLRSTRRSFVSRSFTSRPLLILAIGIALFFIALLAGFATVAFLTLGEGTSGLLSANAISQLVLTIFGGIPLFLTGFYFTMGLLWELNASAESESTDAINWLPLSPGEYVVASSLSTSYTYSPVLMIAYGFALPIAISTGNLLAFSLLIPMAFLASMTGSVGVEILRASLARASGAFNRVGGRPFIIMRILGIVLILVFTQLLFSGFFISRVIGSVQSGATLAALIPILWPTLALTRVLGSDLLASSLFLGLSVGFFTLLGWIALVLKARYWVVPSSAVHFSGKGAVSGPSRLGRYGVSQLSLALLRREVKSATRRKEVIRLTIVPVIIPVLISFPLIFSPAPASSGNQTSNLFPIFVGAPFLFGVGLGSLFLGMTAIGQEGGSIWTLSMLPVTARILVKSKILFTSLVSSIGLVLAGIVTVVGLSLPVISVLPFLGLGLAVILAEASLGMAIGSRFADFSEGPRPRFVTITGSIIGSVLGLMAMAAMVAPVGVALFLAILSGGAVSLALPLTISGLSGLLIAWVGYRSSIMPVRKILEGLSA
jgi:hypothetical protein